MAAPGDQITGVGVQRRGRPPLPPMEQLYALSPTALARAFTAGGFAFWMSCLYLFFEYVRPQAIFTPLDVYPYWARTFVLLALIGWFFDANRRFVWTRISTGIMVFLGVIIVASWNAYWPEVSREYFMAFFNWVVIFFVLTQTVTTRHRFYILLIIFLLASFKLSQHGAITWAQRGFGFSSWGLRGPEGFFQNPGELAIQMVVFAPMALYFALGIRQYLKPWLFYALLLMPLTAVMTVMGTNTRGGQLAVVAQLLAMVLVSKHRIKALLLIAVLGYGLYALLPPEQMERFQTMGEDETSQQRFLYWERGMDMIRDHPVLGVGYFNFVPYFNTFYPEDIIIRWLQVRGSAELPHNIIIQVGTDAGLIGLTVFGLLILMGFTSMRRLRKLAEARGDVFFAQMARGMNLALLGYVVAGQFVTVAYYPYLWIHLTLCVCMLTAQRLELRESRQPREA
ncbi:MAG: O-antigen ligase family protein [Ectothiorhodospiraceae bacterium]|nr:O-antigen ligase family protein [Ectothiorhodospiraceae bacterium]